MNFYPNLCCYLQVQSDYAAQLNRFPLVESVEIMKTTNVNIAGERLLFTLEFSTRSNVNLPTGDTGQVYAVDGLNKN